MQKPITIKGPQFLSFWWLAGPVLRSEGSSIRSLFDFLFRGSPGSSSFEMQPTGHQPEGKAEKLCWFWAKQTKVGRDYISKPQIANEER